MKLMVLSAALIVLAASCTKDGIIGSGTVKTEERNLNAFTKISVEGSTNIHVTEGDNFKVSVKAYANLLPYLKTRVENGVLRVKFENHKNVSNDNSEVFITLPVLNGLSASGSADVDVKGIFESTQQFDANISGSSDISIENSVVEKLNISITGSGDFKSFGLQAKEADITISGSGDVELTVSEKLKAKIRGSGNVYYKGTPAAIDDDISGSGDVIKK